MAEILHLDAEALRVLAHPLRSRLLSRLRLHGPATATDLADVLDTNTGATSYHLRRLEAVGLVDDTGTGEGRRRVWQATTRGHEWTPSELAGDPDAEASMTWLQRHYQSMLGARVEWWSEHQRTWPEAWRDVLGGGDDGVLVTQDQARRLHDELYALLARYRDAGAGQPGAIRVQAWVHLLPVEDAPPDAGEQQP